MMIKVNKKELMAAVDKATVRCKDSIIVSVSNRKNSEGKLFATVCASDGNTQGMATFLVEAETPVSFTLGIELVDVLKAVGEFGDEYLIDADANDTVVSISAGSASMPLAVKPQGTMIPVQTPKKDGTAFLHATFEREAFVKAVRQGSFAYGGPDSNANLASTVALYPKANDDGSRLYFYSSDGRIAAQSYVSAIQANSYFKEANSASKETAMYISVDAPALRSICGKLEEEQIELFIFDKQVSIKVGNDYYTIVRYQTQFPKAVAELLSKDEYNYKMVFDVGTLKAALKVATLMEDKQMKKALITTENGQVSISSVLKTHKALVNAEDLEGEISLYVNAKHIEAAIADMGSDKITFYGLASEQPIYMKAAGVKVITTPIKDTDKEE